MATNEPPKPPSSTAIGMGALVVAGLLALAIAAKVQATTGRGVW